LRILSKWRSYARFDFNEDRYQPPVGGSAFGKRMFRVLHGHDPNDNFTKYLDRGIAALILLSVTLDLFFDVRSNAKELLSIVLFLDWLATTCLTLDLILKWATVDLDPRLTNLRFKRFRFLLRPMTLFDIAILVPSWLSLFFPLHLFFMEYLRILRITELVHPVSAAVTIFLKETHGYTFRRRIYGAFFGASRASGVPKLIDFIIFGAIIFSVFLMTLESVDWLQIMYKPKFHAFDLFITTVFLFDYISRVYCCVEDPAYRRPITGRLRYMLTGGALVDLASVIPFFLGLVWITPVPWLWSLRLIRMLKLARYSTSVSTIIAVVREERAVLSAAIMMLFLVTIFAASGIYVAEHIAQPEKFSSIPASMYWAVITLTSIGYGDYYPITPIGKLLTSLLAVVGLGMIALPAGILANGFSQKIKGKHHVDAVHPGVPPLDENVKRIMTLRNSSQTIAKPQETQHGTFATVQDVLNSDHRRGELNDIIKNLNVSERQALIALTAMSLH